MNNKVILGTVQFGLNYGINNKTGQPSVSDIVKMLDYAKKKGIIAIDTADAYGTASKIIGEYFQMNPNSFFVNTKFKKSDVPIRIQLEQSIKNLNIEKVNTYFFHNFNDFLLYPELIEELEELKKDGFINKIGISIYDNEQLKESIGCESIDTIQLPFNILDNYNQRGGLLEDAKFKGKEIQTRSIFLQGLFFIAPTELPIKLLPLKKYLDRIIDISVHYNIPIEKLAIQYVINQPFVDHVVIGVDNLTQLKKNVDYAKESLLVEVFQELNDITVTETELLYPKNW